MPRTCTICTHKKRMEIDKALARGDSFPAVSRSFHVSEDALKRHKKLHLPRLVKQAAVAGIAWDAVGILEQMKDLCEKTNTILDGAISEGDNRTALNAVREARGNNELVSKLLGQLPEQQVNVQVNIEQYNNKIIFLVEKFAGIIEHASELPPGEVKRFATEGLHRLKEELTTEGTAKSG